MTTLVVFYLICAIVGGALFVLRAIMFFIGFDSQGHGDMSDLQDIGGDLGVDGDFHADIQTDLHSGADAHTATEADSAEGDTSFRFLSLQGLTAFFTMFGLVGLASSSGGLAEIWTILISIAAGGFSVWLISLVFKFAFSLQSEGTLNMENAVGLEGTVYLTIPPNGRGKVNIVIQGALREFEAAAADNKSIATGERVEVVRVSQNSVLIVEKVAKK